MIYIFSIFTILCSLFDSSQKTIIDKVFVDNDVLGNTAKIKILEDGKPIETVLQIVKKEGQLGFRKTSGILEANRLSWKDGQTFLTTIEPTRIGSWMSKSEYELMLSTSQLQKRSEGLTHVLLEGKEHYKNIAGKMYVEFDIPTNTTIARGSGKGWGIFYEPGSTFWKFYNNKGLNIGQPKVSNIKIIDRNGL